MKKEIAVAAIVLATLTVNAQQSGSKSGSLSGGGQGGGPGGQGGQQHQRPSPEQMAEHLLNKFDANKDGKLEQGELTQALEALRAHRPQGGQGGQSSGADGAALGGQGGQHHGRAGGQQGAGQGGSGSVGEHPAPPPADKVAAHMIEKFSSDKKGLTQPELAKALAAHRANRGQHGGGGQQSSGHPGGAGSGQ